MKYVWVLAQSGSDASPSITSEPVGSEPQTESLTTTDGSNGGEPVKKQQQGFSPFQLLLPVMMIVLVFMMFRSPKKQQQKHRQMIDSLSKNDRVRTIGGIIGTVMDIKPDEIVLKVDESTNTKIRVTPSAISKNVSKETE